MNRINADMTVATILALCPAAADVMASYGLHCFHCALNTSDSLADGAAFHGLDEEDLENMIKDLRDAFARMPKRAAMLTVTRAAAQALIGIATQQGKLGHLLCVIADESGGFCMEFQAHVEPDAKQFSHPDVPALTVTASPLTLKRIGGATIDYREGRFKLDLADAAACDCGGSCSCSTSKAGTAEKAAIRP